MALHFDFQRDILLKIYFARDLDFKIKRFKLEKTYFLAQYYFVIHLIVLSTIRHNKIQECINVVTDSPL